MVRRGAAGSSSSSSSSSDETETSSEVVKKKKKSKKAKKDKDGKDKKKKKNEKKGKVKDKGKKKSKKVKKSKKAKKDEKLEKEARKMKEIVRKAQEKAMEAEEKAWVAIEEVRRRPWTCIKAKAPSAAKLEEQVGGGPGDGRLNQTGSRAPDKEKNIPKESPRKKRRRSPSKSPTPSRSSRSYSYSPSAESEPDDTVHEEFACSNCGVSPIRGPRFECGTCKHVSLCNRCYSRKDEIHPRGHKFFAMKALPPKSTSIASRQDGIDPELTSTAANLVTNGSGDRGLEEQLNEPPVIVKDVDEVEEVIESDGAQECAEVSEVLFIRHAVALSNVSSMHLRTPDPPLTEQGLKDCVAARKDWAKTALQSADLVVVSPLRRALQTAVALNGGAEKGWDRRFFISALCSERWSARSDEGSRKSQLAHELPFIRSWQGFEELDEIWWPMHREKELERANKFIDFLRGRPECKLVVVAHGGFLSQVTGSKFGNLDRRMVKKEALQTVQAVPKPPGKLLDPEGQCSVCFMIVFDDVSGVVCRYRREDLSVGGCGRGVCWRCMQEASADKIGRVRIARETWNSLGVRAWWMHESCMASCDRTAFKAMQIC
eukprot:TRINITY_DN35148_c0_g1_i1.p1 TRINITY_DN35148_c0_g1~~TRINITY_DN35148_c0_g1_i1.p1  ORF type:complete len:612 (-),score=141.65 TRINITY_DN35148_c0_g1_i1:178-1980(-)